MFVHMYVHKYIRMHAYSIHWLCIYVRTYVQPENFSYHCSMIIVVIFTLICKSVVTKSDKLNVDIHQSVKE